MLKKLKNKTATTRIAIYAILLVLLFGVVISVFSYFMYRNATESYHANKALAVSDTVASIIDPVRFAESIAKDEPDEYWEYTYRHINMIYSQVDGLAYLYVMVPYEGNLFSYYISSDIPGGFMELETDAELYADEAMDAMRGRRSVVTGIIDAGEWGMLISAWSPIKDQSGNVIGLVGADIYAEHVITAANSFTFSIVLFSMVGAIIIGAILLVLLSNIARPINALSSWIRLTGERGEIILAPETLVKLNAHKERNDDIGALFVSFGEIIDYMNELCGELKQVADGKLDFDVVVRGEDDILSVTLQKTIDDLNTMFREINTATSQVAEGSKHIADGSQTLAQGSTEQAASVQELSKSIADISQKTKTNADLAERAAMLAGKIKDSAEKGNRQMDEMMTAVKDINLSSQNISKVIKSIDDIAFQTNILALNAAVEAARAGQHGKGFAVVAEEVRNLAAKSAEAAKDTETLIADSIKKAELGSRIADETAASLSEIVTGIGESSKLVVEIARSSEEQSDAIAHINKGIDDVAQIVRQNSATADQSAAASQEMSGQSIMLEELISRFKLKGTKDVAALPPHVRGKY